MDVEPVVISGVGAVTGYGWGVDALWRGLLSHKSAARLHAGCGPAGSETGFAARVEEPVEPVPVDSTVERTGLFQRSMSAAVDEAVADARSRGFAPSGDRVGVIHAAILGDVAATRDHLLRAGVGGSRGFLRSLPSTTTSVAITPHDFHGPVMNVGAACASGSAGVLTGKAWLDAGLVDHVVVVAVDHSVSPENVGGMITLGAAVGDRDPLDACRPFQQGSRGFVFGEAAVAMVLSRANGGDGGYSRVRGGAMTYDAYHAVSIDPSHRQIRRCVREALATAGVTGRDVDWFHAHGPGTRQCDAAEIDVLERELESVPALFSVKQMVGHCQGASAALELVVSSMAYDRGSIPAPVPVAPGHPRLLPGPTPCAGGVTLKTAIGMGGHNAAVVLSGTGDR
ncbi:3-oxoacyl-[acyl-carrier-protein] synthase II [Williamsia sterculiae]|uniref:3-oxoacyl-[acyl-carrier-protein] synthase II n=1 Tax=Williamsia sterculiae TaxID=1344003 RepID=A0A1N7CGU6_9NOCA|nr:3-oxoacyl-[acyl-carrier-protein] synthase II [Williamsia sterculiae]